ncbi:MAG: orotidine-5-phosphate decarboxylase [Actinomycetota bacterium]|jgi:orotidine-5'-phosphate decarboxylase|nr:orotidine-5-phosphate decarboxylase [Actinomycetota bacterium]
MTTVIKRPPAQTFLPTNPLCVALDSTDRVEIDRIAEATYEHVGVFKVGLMTFIAHGRDLVGELAARRPVFLDLKLHDIPAQVAGAVLGAADTGASFVTVHASGGHDMLRAAAENAPDGLAVLAVTILTSLDEGSMRAVGLAGPPESAVLRLAELALGAGADGLVCSPLEVAAVRKRFGSAAEGGPVLVVPGIRSAADARGDQRRTLGAAEAVDAGADVIVVGRPIYESPDPAAAAAALAAEVA